MIAGVSTATYDHRGEFSPDVEEYDGILGKVVSLVFVIGYKAMGET